MKNILVGQVVSTGMKDTVVVEISRQRLHPLYNKAIRRSKKFKAHDTIGVSLNDWVRITQSRPYSKDTHWKVIEKVKI